MFDAFKRSREPERYFVYVSPVDEQSRALLGLENRGVAKLESTRQDVIERSSDVEESRHFGEPGYEGLTARLAGYEIDPDSAAQESLDGAKSILRWLEGTQARLKIRSNESFSLHAGELFDLAVAQALREGVSIVLRESMPPQDDPYSNVGYRDSQTGLPQDTPNDSA